jgi:ribonuclease R
MKEQILKELKRKNYRPLRLRELARKLAVPESKYRDFRILVRRMAREGEILRIKGGRYAAMEAIDGGIGVFCARKNRGGFVIPESGGTPIDVSNGVPRFLLHGDKVVYRLVRRKDRGRFPGARIVRIVGRPGATIVGTYRARKKNVYIEPDDGRYPDIIPVDLFNSVGAVTGQKVVAYIEAEYEAGFELECRITEVLGYPGEPHLDIESLIHSYGLPHEFPAAVEAEVGKFTRRIPRKEIERRTDFRDEVTVTIDPENARDFDDAVSVRELSDGYFELGVHIADVSRYVEKAAALDSEALQRGTSVYLVDRVIPMLPQILSADLCSLRPKVNRLTMSCIMKVNPEGRVVSSKIVKSVIRSNARLTYNRVQKFFDAGTGLDGMKEIGDKLVIMLRLSRLMRKNRFKRGSLDFDLPEPLVTLDDEGHVIDISTYPRYDSHRLIEEFMLAANVEVAKFALSNGLPLLFRVHDRPDEEKIANFIENLQEFGYNFSFRGDINVKKLQRVLIAVEGKPEERMINELLLRSMKKAVYQPDNIGHFALGFPAYAHFTSPIRRYPDLIVHRIIKKYIERKFIKEDLDEYKDILPRIGEICSERERLAEDVERESIRIKTLHYIADRIGDVFKGVISGVGKIGIFVELENLFIDGLIKFSEIEDDYYHYDEGRHRAVGRRSGNVYSLGDEIEVFITRVDLENRYVDLAIVNGKKRKK